MRLKLQTLDAEGWGKIWSPGEIDIEDIVRTHEKTVLCGKILRYLETHLGSLSGAKTIEIGCGSAIYSLIFARLGANITLLDYSADALRIAASNARRLGVEATLVQADAFAPPFRPGEFDMALSFGTVEHYRQPKRFGICESHATMVKRGGVVLIETPNFAFLPHEVLKRILQMRGKWAFGFEKGFSRLEMSRLARHLQLRHPEIVGSSLRSDLAHYSRIVRNSSTMRRMIGESKERELVDHQRATRLDDYLGRSIALLGVKHDEPAT